MRTRFKHPAILLFITVAFISLSGCGAMIKSAVQPVIEDLTTSIMKQRDLKLVRDGAPAYLLLIDGMIEGDPEDVYTLKAAARLYSAYTTAFVLDEDKERAKILSQKAKDYAFKALSLENETFAELNDKPFEEFQAIMPSLNNDQIEALFLVVSTWATYIQVNRDNWDNIADIAKVETLVKRMLELDEEYYYGAAHIAMGILQTLVPAALGGHPEEAKEHFKKAIEISEEKFLPAYVTYAEKYARIKFDRKLHDELLNKVMDTPVDIVPELTLINSIARKQAEDLLADADEYF